VSVEEEEEEEEEQEHCRRPTHPPGERAGERDRGGGGEREGGEREIQGVVCVKIAGFRV